MECAKLTAENSECGSYFVQRNDYHVCWCMSKQGVHADCSIRDDWQIHSSGNSYGSIYKLVDPVVTSVYKKTDCRFDYSSTARSAGDYGAHLNTPKTLEECEALCDANPECASFVVDQMGGGKCHLRTECPLVNEDCIEASSWGFINYVKEDCEASSPTSLPDDLPSTMNWTAYVMEYGTNECALGTIEITNEDDCRAAQQQLGLDWNEVVNCNWCPGGCYTSSGWVNWNTHSGAVRVHDAPICRSTVVTSMEVRFTTSDSGDNCDNACDAIGEECIEEMLFLQSAEEVASWALEVNVTCSQILDRCNIGESPIFLKDNGVCTFCSNPNHQGWGNGNRCGAQWDIRQRICPCTSTLAESKSTTTPEESTTELPEDYEFVQGGLCGEDWRDMMRGAIELSRNNGEPAKDPMECAKLP